MMEKFSCVGRRQTCVAAGARWIKDAADSSGHQCFHAWLIWTFNHIISVYSVSYGSQIKHTSATVKINQTFGSKAFEGG